MEFAISETGRRTGTHATDFVAFDAGNGRSGGVANPAAAGATARPGENLVRVHGRWSDCHSAHVRLTDLTDLHWLQPPGAPRPMLHAYVRCDQLQCGNVAHDCTGTPPPHRLLVCVLKCHVVPGIYALLSRQADERRRIAL